jgi:fumarate reductase subunit D
MISALVRGLHLCAEFLHQLGKIQLLEIVVLFLACGAHFMHQGDQRLTYSA